MSFSNGVLFLKANENNLKDVWCRRCIRRRPFVILPWGKAADFLTPPRKTFVGMAKRVDLILSEATNITTPGNNSLNACNIEPSVFWLISKRLEVFDQVGVNLRQRSFQYDPIDRVNTFSVRLTSTT
jgi:hypothetical protein